MSERCRAPFCDKDGEYVVEAETVTSVLCDEHYQDAIRRAIALNPRMPPEDVRSRMERASYPISAAERSTEPPAPGGEHGD